MAHIAEGQCEHGPMSHVNGLHLWVRECNGPTRTSMTQIASVRSDRGARERGSAMGGEELHACAGLGTRGGAVAQCDAPVLALVRWRRRIAVDEAVVREIVGRGGRVRERVVRCGSRAHTATHRRASRMHSRGVSRGRAARISLGTGARRAHGLWSTQEYRVWFHGHVACFYHLGRLRTRRRRRLARPRWRQSEEAGT